MEIMNKLYQRVKTISILLVEQARSQLPQVANGGKT